MSLLKMHLMMVWGVEDYSQQDNLLQVELLLQKVKEFIKFHPVKPYVEGYEIETIGPTFIDFTKTRTVRTIEDESIIYNTGPTVRINNVYGAPKVGMGNTFTVSLRDTRIGSAATVAAGSEIGLARVYDFSLESGSYNSSNGNINEWDISLFDVQTFTTLTLNEATTLNVPYFC